MGRDRGMVKKRKNDRDMVSWGVLLLSFVVQWEIVLMVSLDVDTAEWGSYPRTDEWTVEPKWGLGRWGGIAFVRLG